MSVEGVSPHVSSHSYNTLGGASVLDSSVVQSEFYKSTYIQGASEFIK